MPFSLSGTVSVCVPFPRFTSQDLEHLSRMCKLHRNVCLAFVRSTRMFCIHDFSECIVRSTLIHTNYYWQPSYSSSALRRQTCSKSESHRKVISIG